MLEKDWKKIGKRLGKPIKKMGKAIEKSWVDNGKCVG